MLLDWPLTLVNGGSTWLRSDLGFSLSLRFACVIRLTLVNGGSTWLRSDLWFGTTCVIVFTLCLIQDNLDATQNNGLTLIIARTDTTNGVCSQLVPLKPWYQRKSYVNIRWRYFNDPQITTYLTPYSWTLPLFLFLAAVYELVRTYICT